MTKLYYVEVPVVMNLKVVVPADNEDEALDKVFGADISIEPKADEDDPCEVVNWEWEMHKHVVRGNVYYGGINEPYVEVEEEDYNE